MQEEIKKIYITCKVCGKTVSANSPLTKTCSQACRRKWRSMNPEAAGSEKTCPYCGGTFTQTGRLQVYCKPECQVAARRKRDSSNNVRNVPAICVICGSDFLTARTIMALTCQKDCASELKRRRKAQQDLLASPSPPTDWSFATMLTNCECKTWDCAEMDPMTSRADLAVLVSENLKEKSGAA